MKMKRLKKALSLFLCTVLIVAMALMTTGCSDKNERQTAIPAGEEADAEEEKTFTDGSVLGEGKKEFSFTIVDKEGKETALTIRTDKETVGEALLELGVIKGEAGDYGLFVQTVNGITVDYDKDGAYWAFYVNGEYALSGVDTTSITEGDSYAFKVE